MNERQTIYDELCKVLADYEGAGSEEGASAEDLYNMLVKIQSRWEDVIAARRVNIVELAQKMERAATCAHFDPGKPAAGNCNASGCAPFDCGTCADYKKADPTKNCKLCGARMVWENPHIPGHFHESSCNIDDWPICHDCMVEHCCSTNCSDCEYGKYPDCRFLDMKRHYMSED